MKKRIVCFGDSNTYGFNPYTRNRYSPKNRWVDILQNRLGNNYILFNEGVNGRTTAFDRDGSDKKNGLTHLDEIIDRNLPIDIMTIMLGTNDVLYDVNKSVDEIVDGMEKILLKVKEKTPNTKVILICPHETRKVLRTTPKPGKVDMNAVNKSKQLPLKYKFLAEKYNCKYIDANSIVTITKIDCEHFTKKDHLRLANALCDIISCF